MPLDVEDVLVGWVWESYAFGVDLVGPVTEQYLIGQFSLLLEDMAPSPGDGFAVAVHDLRGEVEKSPVEKLPKLAREAIALSDTICWGVLERGDAIGFCRYAKAAGALNEFTVAAGLLPE